MSAKSPSDAEALNLLREKIDTADADLIRAVGTEQGNGDLATARIEFIQAFQALFSGCAQATREAEVLLSTLEGQLPRPPSRNAIQALLRGFAARAKVRTHKNTTRDPEREAAVIAKWEHSAEAANVDREIAMTIFRIILATSVRMQELQIRDTM
jgi:chorismate mutase